MGTWVYLRQAYVLLLLVAAIISLCLDHGGSDLRDYGSIPSMLGPGAYLAWIVTGLDLFLDRYISATKSGGRQYTRTLLSSRTPGYRNPLRIVQNLTFYGYGIVCGVVLCVGTYRSSQFSQRVAYVENIEFMLKSAIILSIPCHSWQHTTWLFFFNLSIPSVWYFVLLSSSEPASVQGIVWLATTTVPQFIAHFLVTWLKRDIPDWLLSLYIFVHLGLELFVGSFATREPLAGLRPPWPKSTYGIFELDQAFSLTMACLCVLVTRWDQLVALYNKHTRSGRPGLPWKRRVTRSNEIHTHRLSFYNSPNPRQSHRDAPRQSHQDTPIHDHRGTFYTWKPYNYGMIPGTKIPSAPPTE